MELRDLRISRIPWVHLLLFLLTLISTLLAGVMHQGITWERLLEQPLLIIRGSNFAVPLLAILGAHELGHYFFARYYHVDVSLPYFLPAPTFIGTFGAVIRMRSLPPHRRALFDIGLAGPIAGMLVAIPIMVWGIAHSSFVLDKQFLEAEGGALMLGEPLVFRFFVWLIWGTVPEGHSLLLNPWILAGWVGCFVTALNLVPMGQLDGGHILFAVFEKYHLTISRAIGALLIGVGVLWWPGWAVIVIFGIFMGWMQRRPYHYHWSEPLNTSRKVWALAALLLFVVTFIPIPIQVI